LPINQNLTPGSGIWNKESDMTVAELKEILAGYRDEMELFFMAEEGVGHRRLIHSVYDFSDNREKVFLAGRLSQVRLSKEVDSQLSLN